MANRRHHVLVQAAADIAAFLGYVVLLHCLGLGVNWVVTGSPWDPWTPLWRALLHLAGNPTNYTLWVYGTVLVTSVHYWLSAAAYMWLDLTGTPAFLTKYKIQPGKNAPLPPGRLFAVIRTVLLNQLAGIPAGMMSWDLYSRRSGAGQGAGQGAELPDLLTALSHILVCILCHDVWFYYGHRLLHHPRIYKHIHKVNISKSPARVDTPALSPGSPRVDGPHRPGRHLRPSRGAHPHRPDVRQFWRAAAWDSAPPRLALVLHDRPPGDERPLRLPLPFLLLPGVPRLPPPPVPHELRLAGGQEPAALHRTALHCTNI